MIRRYPHYGLAPVRALVLALAGCGAAEDDLPRQAASGRVTLDGAPLKRATIHFDPDGRGQAHPVAAGGVVIDGSYAIPRAQGPTPGSYRVSIFPAPEGAGAPPAEEGPPAKRSRKPPAPLAYHSKDPLKAEVQAGGSNTFDFALSSR
jgi:hypothetical protein